ncbi:hypothetical protein P168DRAFT_304390 [Aspergillus campestris IBT 28561]|uniref:Uncharacterized protein n=1 Tax=Aspergillus campestris (strain IBT 28561) TaxID=1392248 RepID=A0A2I1D2C7_ASPC2|nr:uncharacterized protein P168DRAFT_304390 [Aspergillus campestris IBT 28561]PKY04031.1 hypothetical protein P168DRAFT_304390 [Aspergillus campestris IBT 28561]
MHDLEFDLRLQLQINDWTRWTRAKTKQGTRGSDQAILLPGTSQRVLLRCLGPVDGRPRHGVKTAGQNTCRAERYLAGVSGSGLLVGGIVNLHQTAMMMSASKIEAKKSVPPIGLEFGEWSGLAMVFTISGDSSPIWSAGKRLKGFLMVSVLFCPHGFKERSIGGSSVSHLQFGIEIDKQIGYLRVDRPG